MTYGQLAVKDSVKSSKLTHDRYFSIDYRARSCTAAGRPGSSEVTL